MKKSVSIVLVIAHLMISLFALSPTVFAESENRLFDYIIKSDGGVGIVAYHGHGETVRIPQTIDGQIVTSIEDGVFENNQEIRTVYIPGTVKTIGAIAFANSSIENVYMAEGVETIFPRAFFGCENYKEIVLPSTIQSIGLKAIGVNDVVIYTEEDPSCGMPIYVGEDTTYNEDATVYAWTQKGLDFPELHTVCLSDVTPGNLNPNEDDAVNIADCMLLYRAAAGQQLLSPLQTALADMDHNGIINMTDAFILYQAVA